MKKFFKHLRRILIIIVVGFFGLMAAGFFITKCSPAKVPRTLSASVSPQRAEVTSYSADVSVQADTAAAATESDTYTNEAKSSRLEMYNYYDYKNNLLTYPTIENIGEYSSRPNVRGFVYNILTNLPKITITIDAIELIKDSDLYCQIVLSYTDNDGIDKVKRYPQFSDDNMHLTINLAEYYAISRLEIVIYAYETPTTVITKSINYLFFIYAGEYKAGYGQGFAAGREQGNKEGYVTGAELAKYGIFQDAKIDYDVTYGDGVTGGLAQPISPQFMSNGVYFTQIYNHFVQFAESKDTYLDWVRIDIILKTPFVYTNENPIYQKGGGSDVIDITFTDINNKIYNGEFDYSDADAGKSLFKAEDVRLMSQIKEISIYYGRAEDTLQNSQIYQIGGNYAGGYVVGYNDGYSQGEITGNENGYNIGKSEGYTLGKTDGYAEAIENGYTNEGIFNSALGFLKLFFQLATDFLGTKIIGNITLGFIAIGIPAVSLILNLAGGFVKKLLGGKGQE